MIKEWPIWSPSRSQGRVKERLLKLEAPIFNNFQRCLIFWFKGLGLIFLTRVRDVQLSFQKLIDWSFFTSHPFHILIDCFKWWIFFYWGLVCKMIDSKAMGLYFVLFYSIFYFDLLSVFHEYEYLILLPPPPPHKKKGVIFFFL